MLPRRGQSSSLPLPLHPHLRGRGWGWIRASHFPGLGHRNRPALFFSSMLSQSEKVLAHAEQQLLAKGPASSNDLLGLYKKFLKIENHRIRLRHYSGGGGREICGQLATLVDIVLRHLLENALNSTATSGNGNGKHALPKLALVAIGGYGRGELNPFSDIDIMFLHPDSVKQVGGRFSEVIHQIL